MHANYTKFNALKYLKKNTTSAPNELTVPSVKQKIYENKKKGRTLLFFEYIVIKIWMRPQSYRVPTRAIKT